ncbi:hypothetical protein R3P38DRAFT_3320747 [Favolaschia claudopus]|uniref:Uncharacterized protein n=1 Tax=Favolaschia claudopus TaxID=2862362 RepID=A0AAW0ATL0_9AGAR
MEFLEFIASHPQMQPWGSNPMSIFLFFSLATFRVNCESWLLPCLKELNYPYLRGWNTENVYRAVMNLSFFQKDQYFSATYQIPFPSPDPRFRAVIRETANYRYYLNILKKELYRPAPKLPGVFSDAGHGESSGGGSSGTSTDADPDTDPEDRTSSTHDAGGGAAAHPKRKLGQSSRRRLRVKAKSTGTHTSTSAQPSPPQTSAMPPPEHMPANLDDLPNACPYCATKPMKERCIRFLRVKYHNCKHLIGGALTSAPEHDRLPPKPPPEPKDGEAPKPRPVPRYFHPYRDLKMQLVKFRAPVYEHCGKDIVRFIWVHEDGTWEYVGGVRFKPFSEETLARLLYNHRLVVVRAIRRRAIMQIWAYGTMTATGTRQPMGGAPGDVYGPYACHQGDTIHDINALGREGIDADILVEVGDTIIPGLKTELSNLAAESGLHYLGSTGVSNFTCTNYISCIHPDADLGLDDIRNGRGGKDGLGMLTPCFGYSMVGMSMVQICQLKVSCVRQSRRVNIPAGLQRM